MLLHHLATRDNAQLVNCFLTTGPPLALTNSESQLYVRRAEFVIDAVLAFLHQQNHITGYDKEWASDEERAAENAALPMCDNDFDFKLLRQQLCNDNLEPNSPHFSKDEAHVFMVRGFDDELPAEDSSDAEEFDNEAEETDADDNGDSASSDETTDSEEKSGDSSDTEYI